MNNAHSTATPSRTGASNPSSTRKDQSGIKCPKRILVVDDNIVFLKAMSLKIRAFGYDVATAVDGASAVSTVRKLKPDLILLDLNFPPDVAHGGGVSWDGLLILSWLRRMHEAERIPVIAITAGDAARYKEQCMAAGVVDLFIKPVDHEVLLATIRKALNEEPPERTRPEPKVPEQKPAPNSPPLKRILFVDDETDWRYMGTLYLTECGYEVFTAENAAAAVRQAAKVKPDVIVLDLNLGGDSGITVMNLLTMAHPHVPILIYTGMPLDEGAINDLCDQGAHDCLRKGTMDELLAAVGEAVQAAPAQPSASETNDSIDEAAEAGIRSVLIVEDDVAFGDALRTYLESHPFCVTRVTDGAEALRQIQAEDFDLILCDIVLPNLPGDELHRAVERVKPYLCNRFVFMTGHHAHPSSDDFIRRAGALMMWKPFHLPDVLVAAETVRKKSLLKRCLTA